MTIQQGWQCPGCKMIYAPTQTKCACQVNVGVQVGGVPFEDYLNLKPFKPGGVYGAGSANGGNGGWAYLNQNKEGKK